MSGHGGKKHQPNSSKIARTCANAVASILISAMAAVRAVFKAVFGILSSMAG
jgi:hypothetical protein